MENSEDLEKEVVKFYYFSENGSCGDSDEKHSTYCSNMIKNGYTLISVNPLGNLDDRRDSYEGTIIYHWRLMRK